MTLPNVGERSLSSVYCEVVKTDSSRRLVFGFAVVCKLDGEDYFDLHGDHIPEEVALDAFLDFAKNSRVALEMHGGDPVGMHPFIFPLTAEVAKAMEIETRKTGIIIGAQVDEERFAKFESGELRGFSIAGRGFGREGDI